MKIRRSLVITGLSTATLCLTLSALIVRPSVPVEAATLPAVVPARFLGMMPMVHPAAGLAAMAAAAQSGEIPLPDGKGRDTTKKLCSNCHSTNVFAAQRHTRDQWSAIIDNMVAKGLDGTDDQLNEINDYLAASFPADAKKDAPAPAPDAPKQP